MLPPDPRQDQMSALGLRLRVSFPEFLEVPVDTVPSPDDQPAS